MAFFENPREILQLKPNNIPNGTDLHIWRLPWILIELGNCNCSAKTNKQTNPQVSLMCPNPKSLLRFCSVTKTSKTNIGYDA